jgi:hypothetical protein
MADLAGTCLKKDEPEIVEAKFYEKYLKEVVLAL